MTKPASDSVAAVESALRERLAQMEDGERLPTVRQLMAAHGVGQLVLQRALARLKDEGLITAHVGRGTFVRQHGRQAAAVGRKVLVLTHELQTDRVDQVGRALHGAFMRRDWRSAVLTYSDFDHAMDLIVGGPRIDAAVVQPRGAVLPLRFLAELRQRCDAVVIEGYAATGIDADCIGVDWPAAIAQALRHLIDRGHRRIAYVTMDHPGRLFQAALAQFRLLHAWAGLAADADPVILLPLGPEEASFAVLTRELERRSSSRGKPAPTALIVYPGAFHGDLLLAALKRAKRSVPEDLSVVIAGFTDLPQEDVGRLDTVGLSTVALTESVAMLIEQRWARPEARYETTYIQPEFVERNSTRAIAPPAGADGRASQALLRAGGRRS